MGAKVLPLPCPFCLEGGPDNFKYAGYDYHWCLRCRCCGADGPVAYSQLHATHRWNEAWHRRKSDGEAVKP